MHKKAEDHQDKLKEMQKRHNIMVDRELNSYCTISYGQIYEGAKAKSMVSLPRMSVLSEYWYCEQVGHRS